MSTLIIHDDTQKTAPRRYDSAADIATHAAEAGLLFERWPAPAQLPRDADEPTILAAYADAIARLYASRGLRRADVAGIKPDAPNRVAARQKFLAEHTHDEDEVRFFVEGAGIFYVHHDAQVFEMRLERGDLIAVPAATRHWFDMGAAPSFTCIRLFSDPKGWVATFTGDDIAGRFVTP